MNKIVLLLLITLTLLSACTSQPSIPDVSQNSTPDTSQPTESITKELPALEEPGVSSSAAIYSLSLSEDEPYIRFVELTTNLTDTIEVPCIRGQEVVNEEDHLTVGNSGITMDITALDKTETPEDVLFGASGMEEVTEVNGFIYARSGDSIYVVDGSNAEYTLLYVVEASAYADNKIFERVLQLFGITGGISE